jgi:hypothetical protein
MLAPSAASSTNLTTWSTLAKSRGTPMCRRTRVATTAVCRVLPLAMMMDATIAPSIVTFAAKLPTHTAGHSRVPAMSSAASAIPEGGQTAVA